MPREMENDGKANMGWWVVMKNEKGYDSQTKGKKEGEEEMCG